MVVNCFIQREANLWRVYCYGSADHLISAFKALRAAATVSHSRFEPQPTFRLTGQFSTGTTSWQPILMPQAAGIWPMVSQSCHLNRFSSLEGIAKKAGDIEGGSSAWSGGQPKTAWLSDEMVKIGGQPKSGCWCCRSQNGLWLWLWLNVAAVRKTLKAGIMWSPDAKQQTLHSTASL